MWNSIGVPSVPGLPKNIGDAAIKFGGAQLINKLFGNYWGIFDQNGIPLLLADNMKSVKVQSASKIANAPVEQGSFTSYNKVVEPYSVTVVMTKGSGGVTERAAFLAMIDAFKNSTDLFMVITPEAIYPNCNILSYDYSREASDGARLIKVSLHLQEVREVKVEYTKVKAPEATPEQNAGNVQGKSVSGNSTATKDTRSMAKRISEDGLINTAENILTELKQSVMGGMQ